jgi:capsule polysaccharide export protein KpsE/RkpR
VGIFLLIALAVGIFTSMDSHAQAVQAREALRDISQRAEDLQQDSAANVLHRDQYPRDSASGEDARTEATLAERDLHAALAAVQASVEDAQRQIDFQAQEQKSAQRQQIAYFNLSILAVVSGVSLVMYGVHLTLLG